MPSENSMMDPTKTPIPESKQGGPHGDLEAASSPPFQGNGDFVQPTQSHLLQIPLAAALSHDSRFSEDNEVESLATHGTISSSENALKRNVDEESLFSMMSNMLQVGKPVDPTDMLAELPSPMRGALAKNNDNVHRYNDLDTAKSRPRDSFSDAKSNQNCRQQNAEDKHPVGSDVLDLLNGLSFTQSNDPAPMTTPPRRRMDPESSPSLDPPGSDCLQMPSPMSPPELMNRTTDNKNHRSPNGFAVLFRRPPPGPETSDDDLKESLVMENDRWFGGLLHTPDRIKTLTNKEMDNTLPETPPGKNDFARLSSRESNDGEHDEEYEVTKRKTVKVRLIYFVILFFFLTILIGALAYFLAYLSFLDTEPNTEIPEFIATMRPTVAVTLEPTMAPSMVKPSASLSPTITASPTGLPSTRPTVSPTKRPTRPPTGPPTKNPTNYPTMETAGMNFMNVMAGTDPETAIKMEAPGTNQNRAYQWLIRDPDYFTYSDERKIQRWVLALVSMELKITPPTTEAPSSLPTIPPTPAPSTTPAPSAKPVSYLNLGFYNVTAEANVKVPTDRGGRRLNWNAMESWMQYTDECQFWFTSYYFNSVACNSLHQFKRLVLINLGLEGTIPSEISLMSQLDTIALPLNKISGTIPKEFAGMRWLNTFNVSYNSLEGTIPRNYGFAQSLATLDVGDNMLTAPVPNEICQKRLKTFRGDCGRLQCPCCNRCAR